LTRVIARSAYFNDSFSDFFHDNIYAINIDMIIKDCLFGQVRKLGGFPNHISTDLPNDLDKRIKKQEIITWDNATGMNPLCDYFDEVPNVDVTKMSYGEMISETYDMGFSCVTSLHRKKLSVANYEAYAKLDYADPIAGACKRL